MPKQGRDRGVVASGVVVTVLSILLGGGAAAAAISAVVSSSAPNDSRAVLDGPQAPVAPTAVIQYGG